MYYPNTITYSLYGAYALFSDPLTRVGGEKSSYPIPTYQALVGITESIYWKPTFIWYIDAVRIMNPIRTQTKGVKPILYAHGAKKAGNTLSYYTYLCDVRYQVKAHFEWNENFPDLAPDRNEDKHFQIAKRMLERGGRRDIFLGSRECQGYVEPCMFGEKEGAYDTTPRLDLGTMFHGFNYPNETGRKKLELRLWRPVMEKGVITFIRPEECQQIRELRGWAKDSFLLRRNCKPVEDTYEEVMHK